MKRGKISALVRCVAIGAAFCAVPAYALPGATQAQIVNPVTVVNTAPLDFGRVIPGGVQSRLRVPATSDTIAVTAGTAIPAGGTVSRARFDVIAPPLTLVLVSLPATTQLTRVSGTEQLLVDQFQQSGGAIQLMGLSGQYSFFVGGRLRVDPGQATGRYQGTFTVTVNFL
jgi:hypothetical protein